MSRKYYLCSVGEPVGGTDSRNVIECMTSTSFLFNKNLPQEKGQIEKIDRDDLLLLYYKTEIIAYGIALSKLEEKKLEKEFSFYIKVKGWKTGNPVPVSAQYDHKEAVIQIDRSFALEKIEEMNLI